MSVDRIVLIAIAAAGIGFGLGQSSLSQTMEPKPPLSPQSIYVGLGSGEQTWISSGGNMWACKFTSSMAAPKCQLSNPQ